MNTWLRCIGVVLATSMLVLALAWSGGAAHEMTKKEAWIWSGVWIAVSLGFNVAVYFWMRAEAAWNFLQ